jgi:hypothetical protein
LPSSPCSRNTPDREGCGNSHTPLSLYGKQLLKSQDDYRKWIKDMHAWTKPPVPDSYPCLALYVFELETSHYKDEFNILKHARCSYIYSSDIKALLA